MLSGAVLEPRALNELIPDWKEKGAPLNTPATEDHFCLPDGDEVLQAAQPAADEQSRQLHHQPRRRRAAGWRPRPKSWASRSIPGFAAAEVLYNEDGSVKGVATGDMGIGKDGEHTDNYTPGMELHAK